MTLLIIGLAAFFAAHMFPRLRASRSAAIATVGQRAYAGLFSVVSAISLYLIVTGYRSAELVEIYQPMAAARDIAHALMPFAFLLAAGSQIPSNLKRFVRHPLSWATLLWAVTHLCANGDVASVLLFGAFGVYAILNMTLTSMAGPASDAPSYPRRNDLLLVVVALIGYGAAIWAHGEIFGVYVVG